MRALLVSVYLNEVFGAQKGSQAFLRLCPTSVDVDPAVLQQMGSVHCLLEARSVENHLFGACIYYFVGVMSF